MMPVRFTPETCTAATRTLARRDPALARLIKAHGPCTLGTRIRRDSFAALVRAIVFQQLSTGAATTIYTRVMATMNVTGVPAAGDVAVHAGGTPARCRPQHAEDAVHPRSVPARHRRLARHASAAQDAGRGRHRDADAGEGHRPLDRRDVPDVPPAAARRAAARRPRRRDRVCEGLWQRHEVHGRRDDRARRDVASVPQHRLVVHVARARST